jgi:general secretion pathway protein J
MKARRLGMTLIEVMVAMTIFASMGALIYGGFAQTSRAKKTLETQLERYHGISTALERMVRELSAAYVSLHVNPSPSLQNVRTTFVGKDSGFGDRLDFNSFSHTRIYRDAKEGDQNELSYFLTDAPEGSGKVLARRMQPRPDDEPGKGGRVEVMLEDVLELDIQYLDPLTQEWLRSWDSTSAAGQMNRLPAQVKILITVPPVNGKGQREVYGTRVSLPITYALNHAVYNP